MSDDWSLAVELPRVDPIQTEVAIVVQRRPDAERQDQGMLSPELRLEGRLRGPICDRATTLPTSVPLAASPGVPDISSAAFPAVRCRGILGEPAFWTPDLPMLYELSATLVASARADGSDRRTRSADAGLPADSIGLPGDGPIRIGLRRLWREARSIRLDGHRLVIRGIPAESLPAIDAPAIDAMRARRTSLVLRDPATAAALAEVADRSGILLVVRSTGEELAAAAALSRRHPSVGILITGSAEAAVSNRPAIARGRGLVGLELDATRPPPVPPPAVDFLAARIPPAGMPHAGWFDPLPLPLVAIRPLTSAGGAPAGAGDLRTACDRLQADLARRGTTLAPRRPWDWSGYLVECGPFEQGPLDRLGGDTAGDGEPGRPHGCQAVEKQPAARQG